MDGHSRWERSWSSGACLELRLSWHWVPCTAVTLVEASYILRPPPLGVCYTNILRGILCHPEPGPGKSQAFLLKVHESGPNLCPPTAKAQLEGTLKALGEGSI